MGNVALMASTASLVKLAGSRMARRYASVLTTPNTFRLLLQLQRLHLPLRLPWRPLWLRPRRLLWLRPRWLLWFLQRLLLLLLQYSPSSLQQLRICESCHFLPLEPSLLELPSLGSEVLS